ncbi:MAG: sigma-70 family RNA polymerase sigma factor [Pirellulales bacterium]|nr:sigma-70 family RNA polymerase sigma factor [Pirellulales bacterium]
MKNLKCEAAFLERLTASQQPLYAYLNTLLCGDANVRDVLQETNIDLWQKAEEYDPEKPFLPWAYRFAYFRVLAFRKSRGTSKLVFSDELLQTIDEAYRAVPGEADERLPALTLCLQKLPPYQRHLIELRYELGCSAVEIAKRIGATAVQVGGRLYRLRRLLSDCIEKQVRQENHFTLIEENTKRNFPE